MLPCGLELQHPSAKRPIVPWTGLKIQPIFLVVFCPSLRNDVVWKLHLLPGMRRCASGYSGSLMEELKRFVNGNVVVTVGDITKDKVEAIVNAANSSLMGGGGVDDAIHCAGGPEILKACEDIRRNQYPDGLPTGRAVMTTAGKMDAKYVIHTVGPVYGRGGKEKAKELALCYENSLAVAAKNGVRTVAFPAISTGVYGYPLDEAAQVCSTAIQKFLASGTSVNEVHLVFFSQSDADVFLENNAFED